MEKTIVLYRPEVENYINDLVHILFKKDYFSYLENAILYKDKIIDFIEENIRACLSFIFEIYYGRIFERNKANFYRIAVLLYKNLTKL